jgi:LPXTG-motif cell wall-anchored protein
VKIANQGTYSISGDKIVFTPVTGYVGTATAIRYQVTDSLNQTANATYTPTIKSSDAVSATSNLPSTGSQNSSTVTLFAILSALFGCMFVGISTLRRRTR